MQYPTHCIIRGGGSIRQWQKFTATRAADPHVLRRREPVMHQRAFPTAKRALHDKSTTIIVVISVIEIMQCREIDAIDRRWLGNRSIHL